MKNELSFTINPFCGTKINPNYYNRNYHGPDISTIEIKLTIPNKTYNELFLNRFDSLRELLLKITPINTKEEDQHNERFEAVDKVLKGKSFPSATDILEVLDKVDRKYKK